MSYNVPKAVLRGARNDSVNALIFYGENSLITGTGSGLINVWNLERNRVELSLKSEASILSLSKVGTTNYGR